jgi:hypothetical protein
MTKAREVTKEEEDWIKDNLRYDPETGHFWWIKENYARELDKPAGTLNNQGYTMLVRCVGRKHFYYSAHRAAWFYMYGYWPENHIDHINGNRNDNRIINLREATQSENARNREKQKSITSSKYKGVVSCGNKMWCAQIKRDSKNRYLGCYELEEEAALAYNIAALESFGDYAKINTLPTLCIENVKTLKIQAAKLRRKKLSSRYKGVSFQKDINKWTSKIAINKRRIYLGSYNSEEEAALAYNKAALEIFGENAKINVIET